MLYKTIFKMLTDKFLLTVTAYLIMPLLLFISSIATATTIVDTGEGADTSIGSSPIFHDNEYVQYLAGKITVDESVVVETIEIWMRSMGAGQVDVKIYTDNNNLPGDLIASKTYTVDRPYSLFGWEAFTEFSSVLPPGSFWVAIEMPLLQTDLSISLPVGAPSPLAEYAHYSNPNNRWVRSQTGSKSWGVKITGIITEDIPMGTFARSIHGDKPGGKYDLRDVAEGGINQYKSDVWLSSGSNRAVSKALLSGTGIDVGAASTGGAEVFGAARGLAFRSFYNDGSESIKCKVNARMEGYFEEGPFGLPSGQPAVTAGVYIYKSENIERRLSEALASGEPVEEYILRTPWSYVKTSGFYPVTTILTMEGLLVYDNVFQSFKSPGDLLTFTLSTSVVTLKPHQAITLVFDIQTFVKGGDFGGAHFYDTLSAGADLFTDESGNPIATMKPVGKTVPPASTPWILFNAVFTGASRSNK